MTLYVLYVFFKSFETQFFSLNSMPNIKAIDIQGHRGARGLYPENTITAFIEAIKLGVDTLELDVVISGDSQIVVSHEPWMNELFCTNPNGEEIEKNSEEKYNLYKMPYKEIVAFDCGKKKNPEFPFQKNVAEHKPLLSEVIRTTDNYTRSMNLPPIKFNIELKTEPGKDGIFNPEPETFVKLVYEEVQKLNIVHRSILQSFDIRILQQIRKKDKTIPISLLVEKNESLERNLEQLGFLPTIYGPEFTLVTEEMVQKLRKLNIKLIPWTVNEISDMKKLIALGVDGLITDYPDRAVALCGNW